MAADPDDGWIPSELGLDDPEDWPDLETEEGRDEWAQVLLDQPDDIEGGWCRALVVSDGENVVMRLRFPDGTEEVLDLSVRRSIVVVDNDAESN